MSKQKKIRLTKTELRELANQLHSYDWLVECDVLIPVYENFVRERFTGRVCDWGKEQQKCLLVQYYYQTFYSACDFMGNFLFPK